MLEDFLAGKLFIVLDKKDIGLLKEFNNAINYLTYADKTHVDGSITLKAIRQYGEVGITCSSKRILMYSMRNYKFQANVPLKEFLEDVKFKQFEISEDEINTLFE